MKKLYNKILLFQDKELSLFAASLSFYTISTIIPLFVVILTIITNIPAINQKYYIEIKNFLISNMMPMHSEKIIELINQFINNSLGLGIISLSIMFISSLMFFQNFEYIANKIFKVKEKNFLYSTGTYIFFVIVIPIGLIITFYLSFLFQGLIKGYSYLESINMLKIIPFITMAMLFGMIYKITINTYIHYYTIIGGAIINASVWLISKNIFLYYILYNESYKTIYGTFAIVIYFLLWIYISWIIFIYGIKALYLFERYRKFKKLF